MMQIQILSGTKVSPLPTGLPLQDDLKNFIYEDTQMMTSLEVSASSDKSEWQSINWKAIEQNVLKLQMRIAKAIREGKQGKAKALQWLLTHSKSAKLLAVRRVSQNKGKRTAGIDGIIWNSDAQKLAAVNQLSRKGYKAKPLRRIYIPKKNGKLRPLGIPCMIDRAQQALHLLALEPISETIADPNSYGFRPNRSTADAIAQCFKCLCKPSSAQWILEGDIKTCFDKIGHQWLIDNIPTDKRMLKQWLGCGFIEKGLFYKTDKGTPQGGIISPTLMLLTLAGLEKQVKSIARQTSTRINFIGCADDFIIMGTSKEVLVNDVKPQLVTFLQERGLTLSEEKTHVTHIDDGFDFLGLNLRKYKGKLLIKPSKSNVLSFLNNMRELIRAHATVSTVDLIKLMNPKLRGWANYYRHCVAKRTFIYMGHQLFWALWRWARRRHTRKSRMWIGRKYFQGLNGQWLFHGYQMISSERQVLTLVQINKTPIKRHVKIRNTSTLYDPIYQDYLTSRKTNNYGRNTWNQPVLTAL